MERYSLSRQGRSAVKLSFQLFFCPKEVPGFSRKDSCTRKMLAARKFAPSPFRPLKIMIMVIKIIVASHFYTSFNRCLYFRIITCYGFVQYNNIINNYQHLTNSYKVCSKSCNFLLLVFEKVATSLFCSIPLASRSAFKD